MTLRQRLLNLCYRYAYRAAYPLATILWRVTRQDSVAIAVWVGNRILAVHHSYKRGLSIPKGGVKRGENRQLAAARELVEETGVVLRPSELSLVSSFPTPYGQMYLYEARLEREPTLRVDYREIVYAGFHAVDVVNEPDRTVTKYLRGSV